MAVFPLTAGIDTVAGTDFGSLAAGRAAAGSWLTNNAPGVDGQIVRVIGNASRADSPSTASSTATTPRRWRSPTRGAFRPSPRIRRRWSWTTPSASG